jgi:hypothetical protein
MVASSCFPNHTSSVMLTIPNQVKPKYMIVIAITSSLSHQAFFLLKNSTSLSKTIV